MITRLAPVWQTESWQKSLAEAIRDPAELLRLLELPMGLLPAAEQAATRFPLRVPLHYLGRIEKGRPADPLLLQVLPLQHEFSDSARGFTTDPVGDLTASPLPGLIHKYHGRVLLITTGACAIHCRYCFRRHFPYGDSSSTLSNLGPILDYIRADDSIEEVILSGGDPLSLSTERLEALTQSLCEIPHLQRLRIHSRLPVVLPERVNQRLLSWLGSLPLQAIVVIHANHTREINRDVQTALRTLRDAGVTLLNQAVLLRGVNDNIPGLKALSEALFAAGVIPYYLHQLDRVEGAQHFEVTDQAALALIEGLRSRLPGYLVPRLVREISGADAKRPL